MVAQSHKNLQKNRSAILLYGLPRVQRASGTLLVYIPNKKLLQVKLNQEQPEMSGKERAAKQRRNSARKDTVQSRGYAKIECDGKSLRVLLPTR